MGTMTRFVAPPRCTFGLLAWVSLACGDDRDSGHPQDGTSGIALGSESGAEPGPPVGDATGLEPPPPVIETEAAGEGPTGCGSELFGSEAVPPNVLIVLDRSGSMLDEIDGDTKWDLARDAIAEVTMSYADQVRFGLMMFPGLDQDCDEGNDCGEGNVFVDPAPSTREDIVDILQDAGTCSFGTPIAESLTPLLDYTGLEDDARPNYILLLTDGNATCDDPVGVVASLRAETPPVRTFVVGFGSEVDPEQLEDMAVEGGTARQGEQAYYQADDADGLTTAFAEIAGSVVSCEFALDEVPPDPDLLYAFFGDALVERDPSRTDGWDYDAGTNRVTFFGPSCESLTGGTVGQVSIVFGCPMLPPVG